MKKLQIFQTYYKEEQYAKYNLDKLPDFVEVINTNTYDYPYKELNPFWSEYIFMKYVYENIDKYDCEYIGFDQYKAHFNYDKVLDNIKNSDDVCIINYSELVNVYKQYTDSHKKKDVDVLLNLLTENHHEIMSKYITSGTVPFFWGSCFVMKKERFIQMCQVIFPILDKLDKKYKLNYKLTKYDMYFVKEFSKKRDYSSSVLLHPKYGTYQYQRRCFGYLAERMLATWIMLNFHQQHKLIEIPLIKKRNPNNDKHVLLISHELSNTGAPRALLNMAKILTRNNYTVIVLAPKGGTLEKEFKENNIRCAIVPDLIQRLRDNDPKIGVIKAWAGYALFNTIATAAYSLFFRNTDAKRILWAHEGTFGFSTYAKTINDVIMRQFDEIYAVGNYVQKILQQHTTLKVDTLNYCIDDKFTKAIPTQETNDLHIGVIGSIGLRKGFDLILLGFKKLTPEERQHVYIYFVGNPDGKEIRELIKKYDLKNIKFLGELPNNKVMDFLNYCDCLLCPSRDDPMPICCTEALMMQKPIITSTNTGTASYIQNGKNGFVIESTADSIAEGIRNALANKKDFKKIGKEGRKIFVNNFTEKVFEENIKKIFN